MLTGLLTRNAAARPAAPAIVQGERRITQEELNRETARLANRLRDLGVRQGDVVAIVFPNCPELVIAFFAAMRLHAIAMPLNPNYSTAEIGRFLTEKPAKAVITNASGVARSSHRHTNTIWVDVPGDEAGCDPMPGAGEPFAGDALYLFTSGSTGSTKRVLFTQRNLFFEALNFVESTKIGPDDAILCPVPLYHSYGLCLGMLDAAFTGATLVLEPEPDAPFVSRCPRVLQLLREEQVRVFPGVPWQFAVFADSPGDVAGSFRDVKWCMSSGDMLPRRTYDRFLARTGRRIRSFYGSTEAGSVTIETGPEEQVEFESAGGPLQNVRIAIRDAMDAPAATGESGELWIQSPALTAGYEDDPVLSQATFRDGWFQSGDLGCVDIRGRLLLTGRKQSIISVGSYKVDAAEVEETLLEMPGVREVAVVGVAVPYAGTTVKAVIAIGHERRGIEEKEVRAFCRQRLAMFKVPRIVEFVSELPRDPMGKILRRQLASAEGYVSRIRDEVATRAVGQIHRAPAARQKAMIMRLVEAQAAAVLGCDHEPIPRDAGFADLGMDSFGSIELVTRLELLFGTELSQTFTFDHPTIAAVTDELVARLRVACA